MRDNDLRAFDEPRSKHRMRKIGLRLREVTDRVRLGHGAAPKTCDLRKDEPHPMTGLASVPQFRDRPLVRAAAVLRPDEMLEIHAGASVQPRLQRPE